MMNPYLQVALGGAMGAMARYAVVTAIPFGTLVVNVAGSLAMGLLAALMSLRWGSDFAPLLMSGILGGFTTFSAFSLDALGLWQRGQLVGAAGYVALSVVLSLIAVAVGMAIGRGLWA